jgi:hypothetical protein
MRQFSLRSLMAVVFAVAVGLAVVRSEDDLWAGMLLLVTLTAAASAVLGAAILRGRERLRCAGFALFSLGYLLITVAPCASGSFRDKLGTTVLLRKLHSSLAPAVSGNTVQAQQIALHVKAASFNSFQRAGHSAFALLAGVVGGMVAVWFSKQREAG